MRPLLDLLADLAITVGFFWPAWWYSYGTPFFPTVTVVNILFFSAARSYGVQRSTKVRPGQSGQERAD